MFGALDGLDVVVGMLEKAGKWRFCGGFDYFVPSWAFCAPWGIAWVLGGLWWLLVAWVAWVG